MKICETVMATTMAELRARRDHARDADLVELRLDSLAPAELDVARAVAGRRCPVVATCRPTWEGGQFAGAEEDRLRVLKEAVTCGAEYVDVEWRADWRRVASAALDASAPPGSGKIVLSYHDFEGVPADLADRVRAMRATGAPMIKVAVTATRLRDCLRLRDAMGTGDAHIAIAMGAAGRLTRVLPHFRSRWTYAGSVAAGQFSAAELRHRYRVHETTASTPVFGIAGAPLAHSASPAMHNSAFAASRIDAVYAPFETTDADELIEVAGALGVEGLSITAPLKASLLTRCHADDDSRAIGAVNTLRREASGWAGRNFDAAAFLEPLERHGGLTPDGRALVLGAGGAARAAAGALATRGMDPVVSARRYSSAAALAQALGVDVAPWPPTGRWDLIVNATPVGTWPHAGETPIDPAQVMSATAYDLVYNPRETRWLSLARALGAVTIGGLEMLVAQACRQFEWWTGQPADRPAFEHAALEFLDEVKGLWSVPS